MVSGNGTESMADSGTKPGGTPAGSALIRRRTVVAGAAWAAPAVVGMNALPAWALSPRCVSGPGYLFSSAGGGSLVTAYLTTPTLLGVSSVEVTNSGSDGSAVVSPTGASPAASDDAYYRAFDVAALNGAIKLGLQGVSNLLQLNFNTPLGALNVFGEAHATTGFVPIARGAAGVVSNGGAIATEGSAISQPDLATLQLKDTIKSILGSSVSDLVAGLADLWLQIGAVAAEAGFTDVQACSDSEAAYQATAEEYYEYLVAALRLVLYVDTLPVLWSAVTTAASGLDAGVTHITSLLSSLNHLLGVTATYTAPSLTDLLSDLKSTLKTGIVDTDVSTTAPVLIVDLDATGPASTGNVVIDLAALLGTENGTTDNTLNNLDPNTNLIFNADAVTTLTGALTAAVANLLDIDSTDGKTSTLEGVLKSSGLSITYVPLIGDTQTFSLTLLDLLNRDLTGITLIDDVLGAVLQGLVQDLVDALNAVISAVAAVLGGLVTALHLDEILSIWINYQTYGTVGEVKRFDVSALLVELLNLSGTSLVTLDLAHAYAGPLNYVGPVAP